MADDVTEIELRRLEEERSEDEGMAAHPEKERDPATWEEKRLVRERPLTFIETISYDTQVAFHRLLDKTADATARKVADHPLAAIAGAFFIGVSAGCLASARRR